MNTSAWDELPSNVQDDLTEWFNRGEALDDDDRLRLAWLYVDGEFHAWNCPTCGERVRSGEPDDWSHFQGVNNPDFASYPGNSDIYTQKTIWHQCDDCRSRGEMAFGQSAHMPESY